MPLIPISDITVQGRQRRELRAVDDLADSIKRLGLIHPIVVTRDLRLVAGERRLEAHRSLGRTEIEANFTDDLDPVTLHLIELEENIKREDLTWQERHDAMMAYYRLRKEADPSLTHEEIGEAIGVARNTVTAHTMVERYKDHPLVRDADSYGTARNIAKRLHERAKSDEIITPMSQRDEHTPEIVCADFHEWAPTYDGPKFNLIHCDFPYGINQQTSDQGGVKRLGGYDDSPNVYWKLIATLSNYLDAFCAPSAHMIFWCSANIEIMHETFQQLEFLDGFQFDEVPLIWVKDDNAGIAPDTTRRPRRVYETAFFGWRGDRKLIRTFGNAFAAPTERTRHPHEKSELALRHFLAGIVDEQTRLFDPTCGSGSALRAAKSLGAAAVFGLERDEEFANVARRALQEANSGDRRV